MIFRVAQQLAVSAGLNNPVQQVGVQDFAVSDQVTDTGLDFLCRETDITNRRLGVNK
jgi:hypothetical protein